MIRLICNIQCVKDILRYTIVIKSFSTTSPYKFRPSALEQHSTKFKTIGTNSTTGLSRPHRKFASESSDSKNPCSPCTPAPPPDPGKTDICKSGGDKSGDKSGDKGTPKGPTVYDSRKYSPNLPQNTTTLPFEELPNFPTGVFRCATGETLGPCADKAQMYKNPEYFSFHNYTYFDLHLLLRCSRMPSPNTNRKP